MFIIKKFLLIFGDWGLGIGPNPQSPTNLIEYIFKYLKLIIRKLNYNLI